MNNRTKKHYTNEFKFKVAFASLKGDKTAAALCKEFGVHDSMINKWKKILKEKGATVFNHNPTYNHSESELKQRLREINECLGEMTVENKFLKKT